MPSALISQVGDLKTIASGDLVEIERPGSPDESHHAALGDAAGKNVGTEAGTVAAGDDARFHDVVTLTGTPDYITISGQQLTRHQIDLTADVTGTLPASNLPDASTIAEGVSEQATAAEFRTGTDTARHLGVAETWGAAESAALSDAATVTVSLAGMLGLAHVVLGGNRTLDFTNLKEGQHFILWCTATGSTRTLTMDSIANLWDGVETGPYSITTSQSLFVCGFVPDGASSVEITAIGRRAT